VNNEKWSDFDSIFGWSNWKKLISIVLIYPIVDNCKGAKFRAKCHFVGDDTYKTLYGDNKN